VNKNKRGGWRGGVKPHGPTTDNPMKRRSIRCTDDQWDKLKDKAKAAGLTAGGLVRRWIEDEHLDE
jgi:hypothetical protein